MAIDYHVHLEEGPYSFRWLERTSKALLAFDMDDENKIEKSFETNLSSNRVGSCEKQSFAKGSKQLIEQQVEGLARRLQQGCFSKEWLDLYLMQAKKLGLKEVGIVDHLYRFQETRSYFEKNMLLDDGEIGRLQRYWLDSVMTERMSDFVDTILAAKKHWRSHGVELRLGIEADYFLGCETELAALLEGYPWDYVIGSVHFVDGWGFDNPETVDVFNCLNLRELYDKFYGTVESAIRSNLFDFVAHLDNLKVFGYHVDDADFNNLWFKRIATALVETATATEVNAGLYYRYPVKEMCPGPAFLKVLVEQGVAFTISSDSHFPDDLGKYVLENKALLKELGVQQLVGFEARQRKYLSL